MATAEGPQVHAGIYCRISQDRAGDELGVDRQRELCTKLAADRGWEIARTYVDDDVSAFKRRRRPGFEELKRDIDAGAITAVIAVDQDRIARRLGELVDFLELLETRSGIVVTTAGDLDSTTADGILKLHILGAVAENESRKKSERVRRQREQAALSGRPHGGRRPYGYDPTGTTIVESEAAVIREIADRLVTGEGLRSIAAELNRREVPSPSGQPWVVTSLRSMITGPRLAALRVHRGEVIGPASWPPILTLEEHQDVRALLGNPRANQRGRPPTSLLGGLLRCSCGAKMHASTRSGGARRYMCPAPLGGEKHRSGGCGRVAITAERTEAFVVEAAFLYLDRRASTFREELDRAPATADSVGALEQRLTDLAEIYAAGDITRAEWMSARALIDDRLERARRRASITAAADALSRYPTADSLRAAWPALDHDDRRRVLAAIFESVTIAPAARAGQFDSSRIDPRPRSYT